MPPNDRTLEGLLKNTEQRITLVERRLATGGSGALNIEEGPGIDIDGVGTPEDPMIISMEHPGKVFPPPINYATGGVHSISATAWAPVPGTAVQSMTVDRPLWVQITVGAWMIAGAGETRASVELGGATILAPPANYGGNQGAWGQTLYASASNFTASQQLTLQKLVKLNPGTTTFTLVAYLATAGSHSMNYPVLDVAPLFWDGEPAVVAQLGEGDPQLVAGAIMPYAGATAPTGWLFCDGSAVSRTSYAELFAAIGTAYGAGNGTSTFNLPKIDGRTLVGRDSTDTAFDVLGETGGAKTHTLTIAEMPAHQHQYSINTAVAVFTAGGGTGMDQRGTNNGTSSSTGGGGAHNNLQPYLVTNFIISTRTVSAGGGGGGWAPVDATETVKGIAEVATQAETTTGTSDAVVITPLKLAQRLAALPSPTQPDATEVVKGIVELATAAETLAGTDNTRAVHPLGLKGVADTKAPLSHTHTSSQITDFATAVPAAVPASSETVQGKIEIATAAEVTTGTDDVRAVTPLKLAQRIAAIPGATPPPAASETVSGIAEIATTAEVTTGTDDLRFVTPLKLQQRIAAIPPGSVADASETVKGVAELATTAEVTAGTDDLRIVTPLKLAQRIAAIPIPPSAPAASETVAGIAEIATAAEAATGTDHTRIITPLTLATGLAGKAPLSHTHTAAQITDLQSAVINWAPEEMPATETIEGVAEIATAAEVTTGTDDSRIVTPLKLAQRIAAIPAGATPYDAMAGLIMAWGSNTPPSGWLICDGSLVGRATYPELFAAIGTTYGAGDGSTTFSIPDYRGRALVGRDAGQTEFDDLGETGGSKTHTLTIAQMPGHTHTMTRMGSAGTDGTGTGIPPHNNAPSAGGSAVTNSTGGGAAHNNLQPYAVANWIISTGSGIGGGGSSVPALPAPIHYAMPGAATVVATSFATLPGSVPQSLTVSHPLWVLVTLNAWIISSAGETRAGIATTGATVVAPHTGQDGGSAWGAVHYAATGDTGSAGAQRSTQRVLLLNPGTTNFEIQAYLITAGTHQLNYSTLEIIPIAWDGQPGSSAEPGNAMRHLGHVSSVTQSVGNITTTPVAVPGISLPISLTRDGRLRFNAQVSTYSNATADVLAIRLLDGSTVVAEWTKRANSGTANAATTHTHNLAVELDVATGAHAYTLAVLRVVGTGTASIAPVALFPSLLSVDQIG